ncbi:MAG: aldose epimerase [Candidatus Thermoplasmatota archaeon]
MADDPEWTLSAGPWRATVSPVGASLRRLSLERPGEAPRDVLWGYSGTANKKGGQGDVLMPWPGRIRDCKYSFAGKAHDLPKNDKEGPNAIHGFLRSRTWEGEHDGATARFRTRIRADDHSGYPFDLDVVLGYELLPAGLACAFVVRNAGTGPAPFGAGFHPYVLAGGGRVDDVTLRSPAAHVVEFDGLLPTGRVAEVPAELDFRAPRRVGATRFNHCFTGLGREADGFARVRVDDIEVWMDRGYPYVVLYTGEALGSDARRALAIEPMTCATDAFNHPKWGLRVLGPGEAMTGTWGVGLRP